MEPFPEYLNRVSILEKETLFRLQDDHLVRMQAGEVKGLYPLKTLQSLRLRFHPTRAQPNRYECILQFEGKPEIKLVNEYFKGVMDFRDQSPDYGKFIESLVNEVNAVGTPVRFFSGSSPGSYLLNMGCLSFALVAFVVALVYILSSISPAIVVVKMILLAIFLPLGIRFMIKNLPREFDPASIPESVLPN
jgi:hypothetical protein